MGGLPAEGTLEFFLAGNQHSGISGTARTQLARDFAAGDALRRSDNFQDREAAAVAHVEGFAGNALDLVKRADVRIGDIEHMDVVADAGSVRCGVVRAEDIDMGEPTSGSSVQNARDEVSFVAMMLAAFPGGSGCVEIAERHIVESGVDLVIREDLFEYELGFAVGVDGRLAMVFGDGNDFGFAVSGGSGRKNEFLYAVAGDGIEQIHAAGHVGGVESAGLPYGFGDQGLGGEVHDGVNLVQGEDGFKLRAIREIHLAKDGARRHGSAMALQQAVQRDDGHAARNQDFRADTADVTRRSGNENIHLKALLESGRDQKWRCSKLPEPTARCVEKQGAPARKFDKGQACDKRRWKVRRMRSARRRTPNLLSKFET